MKVAELYKIAQAFGSAEREHWIHLFRGSLKANSVELSLDSFERFIIALYVGIDEKRFSTVAPAIAYGAGNIAQEYLPKVLQYTRITEIWDAYAGTQSLFDIPVVKPDFGTVAADTNLIVLIENNAARYDVELQLISKGYKNVYSYKEFLLIALAVSSFPCINEKTTEETVQLLSELINQYKVIDCNAAPVNYSIVPKKMQLQPLNRGAKDINPSVISERLYELLTFSDSDKKRIANVLSVFIDEGLSNAYSFAYYMEILLRNILANGIKTKERPIRMLDDNPYDRFAVYTAIREIIGAFTSDKLKALAMIELLRALAPDSVPLMSVECHFLMCSHRFDEALKLSRHCMKKEPNGLLSNETFYRVALQCKNNGLCVFEPLPEYNLGERYCWSGMSFALCSGFRGSVAEFLPCFRTLQCAANPKGDFWSGDEWIEFRKSLMDGSFRYCQKNQCSNIVAGWLPKKSDCGDYELRKIFNGDISVTPQLEELHFSYDFHCNLKCPSCRLEIKLNSAEKKAELDELFENNLRPLLKNSKHMCLSGCGEAIISPHSKGVLQSLSREEYPELAVELRTNIFSLNSTSWNALGSGRGVIRHIAVSVDAASKELFERLRYPAKWEIVLKNLTFIQSLRNAGKIDMLEFHVVVQIGNIGELIDLIKMAAKYDADAITFSQLVNWRGMSEMEYQQLNPFLTDNPHHDELMQVIEDIKKLRDEIENGECDFCKKKLFINMHCVPDPNQSYSAIRVGKLKIR